MLHLLHPPGAEAERRYVWDVLLRDFLGLEYGSDVAPRRDVRMTLQGDSSGRELLLADILFRTPEPAWLTPSSLPRPPLEWVDLAELPVSTLRVPCRLPVLYGDRLPGGSFCEVSEQRISLGLDLFGSAFFLLTRYEEVVKADRDAIGRFPASAALAYQQGFLGRPIVNEYLELLWGALRHLWPGLQRRQRRFQISVSHDVDFPLCVAGYPCRQVLRQAGGDLVKRKSPALAIRRLHSLARVRRGDPDADLCNTFDRIMTLSEERGLRSAFYFIPDNRQRTGSQPLAVRHTPGRDGSYSLDDPWIRRLLRRIHARGHEVGLHPSFDSFRDAATIRREAQLLRQAAEAEGNCHESWGGRQHWLRWEAPTTWQAWEDAGLDYDSSLSFAEHAGFRCGVCYEYPVFNLKTRRGLRLRERPLIVMDVSLLDGPCMNLRPEQAWKELARLREQCLRFDGIFTLLWHNCRLIHPQEAELYRRAIELC